MSRILLAGATGALGRRVLPALLRRGHDVVALARRDPGDLPGGVPVHRADPLDAASLGGAFEGIEVLVSCLGASTLPDPTKGRAGFDAIDWPANRNLVDAARDAGVRKVVYVSVAGAREHRDLAYFDAHERVVDHLVAIGMPHTIVRPTGFFSAIEEYLSLARRGVVPLFGDGSARSNPIDDDDLAEVVADAVTSDATDLTVGGPEVLPRRAFGGLAFEALGRTPRFLRVPIPLVLFVARIVAWFAPRLGQVIPFIVRVSTHECIGQPRGTRRLADHFRDRVAR